MSALRDLATALRVLDHYVTQGVEEALILDKEAKARDALVRAISEVTGQHTVS